MMFCDKMFLLDFQEVLFQFFKVYSLNMFSCFIVFLYISIPEKVQCIQCYEEDIENSCNSPKYTAVATDKDCLLISCFLYFSCGLVHLI